LPVLQHHTIQQTLPTISRQFEVAYTYALHFTRNVFGPDNTTLIDRIQPGAAPGQPAKVAVVIDAGLAAQHPDIAHEVTAYFKAYPQQAVLAAPPLLVTGGEAVKNTLKSVYAVLELINTAKIDRHAYVVAVGGGAVLDMAGFAATIAHRGVRHIRIPTTVLSQDDSGVGVKNSMNFFGKKNFLGTFAPPAAVINDTHLLLTLDDRNWRAGISEALKVALIKDADFFNWIEQHTAQLAARDLNSMELLIHRCAEMHMHHIASQGDPFERGSSRPLDFGHWAAHKLEQLTNYAVLHGEAVAIGICLDAAYAHLLGWLPLDQLQRIITCFKALGFTTYHPLLTDEGNVGNRANKQLLQGLEEFREHLGGQLTIMLLKAIGQGTEVHEVNPKLVGRAVHYLRNT